MKKGVVVFTGFAFLLAFSIPAVAQPSSKAVETRVIDNFDNVGSQDKPQTSFLLCEDS